MAEITPAADWEGVRQAHRWILPPDYNLAHDMVGKWALQEPGRLALRHLGAGGVQDFSYRDLDRLSNQLANVFAGHGLKQGDRVAVLLPQCPETMLCHLAAYKLGAVVVPLFTLFGAEGLSYRIDHSGARMLLTDSANLPKLEGIGEGLEAIFCIDGAGDRAHDLRGEMERTRDAFDSAATTPETPAFISYTSGTTGPPKGALHGHRVLLGHLPGVQLVHDFFPKPGAAMWTPADWAWMGGLCNIAMPSLRFGVPLLSHRMERFDPERAFEIMRDFALTNVFLPPTALKLMRQVPDPRRFDLSLRTVGSGGESLGAEMLDWGRDALGMTINEFYGQTECNMVLGNCASINEVRPGSMGKAMPGSTVAIIDEEGRELPPGETGEIAIGRGDAAMFLEYWRDPERTAEKFNGDWMLTGDEGVRDEEGYFYFNSRTDDVITSSGYRIGPTEIEHCLTGHPAVEMAAVIGVPDPIRTEMVKAFVTLGGGRNGDPELAKELIAHVRTRLSPHVAPREVVFIDRMPTTATGKILRRELRGR
ncbi:AMP-binding protein [Rhodobacteraceae bacterium NNCM2]|nr:AMP-binding protein [Coraliihabitans acroporae]